MKMHGDELGADQFVLVDGKSVISDVKELDTDEGWVEIFVPDLPEEQKVVQNTGDITEEDATIGTPTFDWKVQRLEGKIEVRSLNDQ